MLCNSIWCLDLLLHWLQCPLSQVFLCLYLIPTNFHWIPIASHIILLSSLSFCCLLPHLPCHSRLFFVSSKKPSWNIVTEFCSYLSCYLCIILGVMMIAKKMHLGSMHYVHPVKKTCKEVRDEQKNFWWRERRRRRKRRTQHEKMRGTIFLHVKS